MFGFTKVFGTVERAVVRSVWKPCVGTSQFRTIRMYTQGSARRRFLIPYVYRSKSFNIHTDSREVDSELYV